MSLVALAFMLSACGSPKDPAPTKPSASFEGVAELVAGEPVFAVEIDSMVARGVPVGLAREHLRGLALLASEARKSPGRVSTTELELLRRRAAVQLYLRELREMTETPSDAVVRERYEASGDQRPFDEAAEELRRSIEIELTFARIVERIMVRGEEVEPEVTPEALPELQDLRFSDGAP